MIREKEEDTCKVSDFIKFEKSRNYEEQKLVSHLQYPNISFYLQKSENSRVKCSRGKIFSDRRRERDREKEVTVTMAVRPKKWESITVPMAMALSLLRCLFLSATAYVCFRRRSFSKEF